MDAVIEMDVGDDIGAGMADQTLRRVLNGVVAATARVTGGLLDVTGDTLLGTWRSDDVLNGDAGANAGLAGRGVTGITRTQAGGWKVMQGVDGNHVGQRPMTDVAKTGDTDGGMISGKVMADRMALGAGVSILISDRGPDLASGTGMTEIAGVSCCTVNGFNSRPGDKCTVASVAAGIGCDVVGWVVWGMALKAGVGIAVVDGGDDL